MWKDVAWENVTVGDFDGDGRDDIAARHKFGWWVARTTDNGFETSLWGTWNNVDWTAVAAIETANPPVAPATASAQTAFATSEQDAVATLWSSTDDDEFASTLLAVYSDMPPRAHVVSPIHAAFVTPKGATAASSDSA